MTTRPRQPPAAAQPIITPAEVGAYAYCAKAWHLKRHGAQPRGAQLRAGTDFHQQHGATTAQAANLERAGRRLVGLAFLLLVLIGLYLLLTRGAQ